MLYYDRGEKMKQKWKPMQFVEISMHEIFAFQDRLDAAKDEPEKVWEIVDDFFWEAENQLELDPNFIKEMHDLDLEADFIELKNIEELFEENVEDYHPAHIDVLKSYKSYKQKQQDIPFIPRHNF